MHNTELELGRGGYAPNVSDVGYQEDDLVGLSPSHNAGSTAIIPSISGQCGK